jgi:hypothetical protein
MKPVYIFVAIILISILVYFTTTKKSKFSVTEQVTSNISIGDLTEFSNLDSVTKQQYISKLMAMLSNPSSSPSPVIPSKGGVVMGPYSSKTTGISATIMNNTTITINSTSVAGTYNFIDNLQGTLTISNTTTQKTPPFTTITYTTTPPTITIPGFGTLAQ